MPGQTALRAARAGQWSRGERKKTLAKPVRTKVTTARHQEGQLLSSSKLRFLWRPAQHRPSHRGAMAPHRLRAFGMKHSLGPCKSPPSRRGPTRGLTQLAGGSMEARGTDTGPGDRVALLGGSGTLADLPTALPEGSRQAGCQERGHRGDSDWLRGSNPTPPCKTFFFPFLF